MLLLFLFLLPISYTANIFTGAFLGGSHLTAIYEVALILAEAGHNVTFVHVVSGGLKKMTPHPNLHGVEIGVWSEEDKDFMWEGCTGDVVKSETTRGDLTTFRPECIATWETIWGKANSVFGGEEVLEMFQSTQFDVIIGEAPEVIGTALLGTLTNVPVVHFEASFLPLNSLVHGNLPFLFTSQPSIMFDKGFHHSPTIMERLSAMGNALALLSVYEGVLKATQPALEKHGFSSLDEIKGSVKLFLTNDHPAFTFPYLRAPNDIPIGCANLFETKNAPLKLSPQVTKFLEESEGKDVVYVSFGSYVKMSEVSWYSNLIDILITQDLRVIVKVDKFSDKEFSKSVLPLTWAPQKDLLRSGKIKFFVSHCGNNGRLEAMFYNVPVLCVPQFADQPVGAEIVKLNQFGNILLKEDIKVYGKEMILTMISNHGIYLENLKRASDVVEKEPGNVKENLIFYVGYLAKHKNVDFLVNKVIKKQSMVEIYNLDIILPVCLILVVLLVLFLFLLYKFCLFFGRKFLGFCKKKAKNE